jgi:hypothetical protein
MLNCCIITSLVFSVLLNLVLNQLRVTTISLTCLYTSLTCCGFFCALLTYKVAVVMYQTTPHKYTDDIAINHDVTVL